VKFYTAWVLVTKKPLSPYRDFSGGWRIRLNLAQALMAPSDMLLLDEPTNHLDLEAILWLENWLKALPGRALLIIAHDRAFLDSTVTQVLYLLVLKANSIRVTIRHLSANAAMS